MRERNCRNAPGIEAIQRRANELDFLLNRLFWSRGCDRKLDSALHRAARLKRSLGKLSEKAVEETSGSQEKVEENDG